MSNAFVAGVDMVKFVKPESSYDELEKLLANAEKIFQL